jgi:hypothetical protein
MAFVRDLFADGKQTLDFLLSRNRGMELKVGGSRQPHRFSCAAVIYTPGLILPGFCRTLVLMDATGSMTHLLEKTKSTIATMYKKVL